MSIQVLKNPLRGRGLPDFLGMADGTVETDARAAQILYAKCPAGHVTPFVRNSGLARDFGVADLWLKMEDQRMGLGSFKALGAAYAIAKLVHDADEREMVVDLDAVWRHQDVSSDLKSALLTAAAEAQDVITHPPEGVRNFSEWAKKQACWKQLEDRKLEYPEEFDRALTSLELADERARAARAEMAVKTSVEAELEVHRLGAAFWSEARNWARERGLLSPRENGVLETCAAIPNKLPSEKQCAIAISAVSKLKNEGFSAKALEDSD